MASIETPVSRRLASVKNIIIVVSGKGELSLSLSCRIAVYGTMLIPGSPLQVESAKVPRQFSWRSHFSILRQPHGSDFSTWTLPGHPCHECLDSMGNQFISLPTDGFPCTRTGSADWVV